MMTPPPHVHQIRLASAERHWHGRQDCAASVFKMAFAGRGTSEFQVFSNVLQDRRPGSSRVIPAHSDPLAVHVAVHGRGGMKPSALVTDTFG